MTVTASSMILNSLVMTGEKSIGGSLSSAEQTHHLARLNAMLEAWSIDRQSVYQLLQESKALTTSNGTYTIGTGGVWNTTRPTAIVDPCFTRDSSGIDRPITLISAQAYGAISTKTLYDSYPEYLFYDSAYIAGLATIRLYPTPLAGLTLYINSWKQLQSFSTISDALALPPGYQEAIETNYAIRAAVGFRAVAPELMLLARESKAAIKRINAPEGVLRMPSGVARAGHSNILVGP